MRTCPKCNKETMEDIDVLNSVSRKNRDEKKIKYDICRPCGEQEYKEEKEWEDARYEAENGTSERESSLRWEAYELGIRNASNYPFEMLENLVKEEKKRRSEYRRGVWRAL